MALISETSRAQYTGNDVTTTFTVPFYFLESDEIRIILTSVANVDSIQVLTTQYTVDGAGETSGGTITMVAAPSTGEKITILRDMDFTQLVDYVENDTFPADTHERTLDKLTMIAQQLEERTDRAITLSASSTFDGPILPDPVADYYLQFDSNGNLQAVPGDTSGLQNIVEDLTPQLGGNLDANSYNIQFDDSTGIKDQDGQNQLIFQKTTSAVNYLEILNASTGVAPKLSSVGDDTNVGLTIDTKGTGQLTLGSADVPIVADTDSIDLQTGSSSRIDITDAGVSFGGANSRITTFLDEDNFASDSDTALATQQSIKAYVGSAGGKVKQIVQGTLTSAFSTSSTTYTALTGLSVDITPTSSSSKILVLANVVMGAASMMAMSLYRDASPIFEGDVSGTNRTECTSGSTGDGNSGMKNLGMTYLDSPSTTSEVTYQPYMVVDSGPSYVNRTTADIDTSTYVRTASSIVVIEIGA